MCVSQRQDVSGAPITSPAGLFFRWEAGLRDCGPVGSPCHLRGIQTQQNASTAQCIQSSQPGDTAWVRRETGSEQGWDVPKLLHPRPGPGHQQDTSPPCHASHPAVEMVAGIRPRHQQPSPLPAANLWAEGSVFVQLDGQGRRSQMGRLLWWLQRLTCWDHPAASLAKSWGEAWLTSAP